MSSSDINKKVEASLTQPAPPRTPASANADIKVTSNENAKVSVTTGRGVPSTGGPNSNWPKDSEDWKRVARAAVPWLAGAAIVLAAATGIKKARDADREHMGYGELTERKARRAWGKGEEALQDAKDRTERGWFGLKRRASETADDAGNKLNETKDAAARKAREAKEATKGAARDAQGVVKQKAHEVAEGTKEAGWWAGEKAHEAADAAKGVVRSTADAAGRAAGKVEEKVAGAGSAALANASAAEEKTGRAMRVAGEKLEKDGAQAKRYYRGEEIKEKKGCSIM